MSKKPKEHAAICPSCERLPVWLRDWPAEVSTQLMAGVTPEAMKAAARELWERYCDRVVDGLASEIRGECRNKWVRGLRKQRTPPWCDEGEKKMHICKLCGDKIQDNPVGLNGRCGTCGQRYWFGQPSRPELTEEQWAVLKAHAASEGKCEPNGKVKA